MAEKLNDTKVERLKHRPERYDVRDTVERGLLMRVGAKEGSKAWWTFVYRGKSRKMVRLGSFPKLNTSEARRAAIKAKLEVGVQAVDGLVTASDLFAEYKQATEPKRRSWRDVQIAWDRWAKDHIGHLRLQDITVHHGREMRKAIAEESTELRANSVIRYIRPMFSWAADESLMDANPWASLKAKVVAAPRDRVLTSDEWQAVWEAARQDSLASFWQFLMLSAQRVGNVSTMRWRDINDDVWTIPKEEFKATRVSAQKAHEVPLTPTLRAIVNSQERLGEYVFGVTGQRPLRIGSRQRDRLGKASGVENWVLHDLRRTAATRMAEKGVDRFIIERILGHTDKTVTAVYDRFTYRDEKRAALETLVQAAMTAGGKVEAIHGKG